MSKLDKIQFVHDFYGTVNELEVILCIDGEDYSTRDVDSITNNVKDRLRKRYALDFSRYSLTEMLKEDSLSELSKEFADTLYYSYNRLCGDSTYFVFTMDTPVSLAKVNYLGITRNSMNSILILLQKNGQQDGLFDAINQIRVKLLSTPMCIEKKLFMCLCVAYDLGLFEIVGVLAQILYVGGKK